VVRNLWRLYGGWYDQNPAHLKPAADADLARALADLAGGAEVLAQRAAALAAAGELRLACHFAEWAAQAAPEDRDVAAIRGEVYAQRAGMESSTMAKGISTWASVESRARAQGREMLEVLAASHTGTRDSIGSVIVPQRRETAHQGSDAPEPAE
jgi:alkyl sulfatase BDS1-like metallo-beta-lactamase superfamily hydrolase